MAAPAGKSPAPTDPFKKLNEDLYAHIGDFFETEDVVISSTASKEFHRYTNRNWNNLAKSYGIKLNDPKNARSEMLQLINHVNLVAAKALSVSKNVNLEAMSKSRAHPKEPDLATDPFDLNLVLKNLVRGNPVATQYLEDILRRIMHLGDFSEFKKTLDIKRPLVFVYLELINHISLNSAKLKLNISELLKIDDNRHLSSVRFSPTILRSLGDWGAVQTNADWNEIWRSLCESEDKQSLMYTFPIVLDQFKKANLSLIEKQNIILQLYLFMPRKWEKFLPQLLDYLSNEGITMSKDDWDPIWRSWADSVGEKQKSFDRLFEQFQKAQIPLEDKQKILEDLCEKCLTFERRWGIQPSKIFEALSPNHTNWLKIFLALSRSPHSQAFSIALDKFKASNLSDDKKQEIVNAIFSRVLEQNVSGFEFRQLFEYKRPNFTNPNWESLLSKSIFANNHSVTFPIILEEFQKAKLTDDAKQKIVNRICRQNGNDYLANTNMLLEQLVKSFPLDSDTIDFIRKETEQARISALETKWEENLKRLIPGDVYGSEKEFKWTLDIFKNADLPKEVKQGIVNRICILNASLYNSSKDNNLNSLVAYMPPDRETIEAIKPQKPAPQPTAVPSTFEGVYKEWQVLSDSSKKERAFELYRQHMDHKINIEPPNLLAEMLKQVPPDEELVKFAIQNYCLINGDRELVFIQKSPLSNKELQRLIDLIPGLPTNKVDELLFYIDRRPDLKK